MAERRRVDDLRGSLRELNSIVSLLLLTNLLTSWSSVAAKDQMEQEMGSGGQKAVGEKSFDWHWGSWRIVAIENCIFVHRHQANVLRLLPPSGMVFENGRWRGPTASLKFRGSGGEGVWFFGLTANGLNLVAQHTLHSQGVNVWRWVIVNPNLLRGAPRLPSGEKWSGTTLFGAVSINIGGAGAQIRWRQTDEGPTAELLYPVDAKALRAQLEINLPAHWLLVQQPKGEAAIHPIDIVQGEFWDLPLMPEPKWVRWGDSSFRFGREVLISIADEAFHKAAENLRIYLQSRWLRQVTIQTRSSNAPLERCIIIAPQNSPLREKAEKLEPMIKADLPPEGYFLLASPEGIWILSADAEGAFWAIQTLKQLIRLTDDGAVIVPEVYIRDYPDFAFRGVHFVIDDFSPEFHRRLIEQVWAPLKFNKLIMQVDHLKWESHPELWQSWSLPKEEAKQLQRIAEANNMEVIPLLPTLSHCEYLFGSLAGRPPKVNREIAEDPETSYLYCPNLEQTYRIVFDLLGEVISLFKPRWVHIGHDEVLNRGRFGSCIRCQGTPPHLLFAADVKRLYEFLNSRGIKVMMWGDMLLRPEEAYDAAHGGSPQNFWQARKLIPRDITIVDWHYQPAPKYPSIGVLRREGFEVIGATWQNFTAIVEFSKAAKEAGALGMIQTTWTGFGNNRNALKDFPDQFSSYVVAANQFWNVSGSAISRGYSAWNIFETLFRGPTIQPMSGFVVDLSPLANLSLAKVLGVPPKQLTGGRRWLNRRIFWLATDEDGSLKAVALKGTWLTGAPDEISLTIGESASELTFVHATDVPIADNSLVSGYEILFEGGRKVDIQLRYGQQIRALNDTLPLKDPKASFAWSWTTAKGKVSLTALTIPFDAERVIQRIRFYSSQSEAAPLLVAITGISSVSISTEMP